MSDEWSEDEEYVLMDFKEKVENENDKYSKALSEILDDVYKILHKYSYWKSDDISEKEFKRYARGEIKKCIKHVEDLRLVLR